ncbi:extracellular solute-binding protein [Georgenia halophila]|uniref:Extracellular solute-binding protein n=1 Tax=Georgenia halophila TaxID=620889 RepID=A0ABP8LHK8_9MICO
MKITHRRALGGVTAASLALTMAACSTSGGDDGGGGGGEPADLEDNRVGAMENFDVGTTFEATEPLEFSLLYRNHPNYPLQEDWLFFEALESNQNVTFDITSVPLSDWAQRRSVLIGAGDAPMIMPITYPGDETQYVASGTILPISDYVQHMPNFQAKVEEWGLQPELEQNLQANGKYYMIPGLHENPKPQYSIVIRKDLFEEAGITEAPETFEDFQQQLETVMAEHPELDYGLSDRWSINGPMEATLQAAAPNFGTEAGWGYGDGLTWKPESEEFVYTGASDEYRSLLEYFAGLVESGVMDPESVTQEDDTAIAKFTNGQSAAIGGNDQEILNYRQSFEDAGVDAELKLITVPAGPAGSISGTTRTESGLMFSAEAVESPNFVAMLQFVDWLYYSDEGLEFAKWGVEGETYNVENGDRELMENIDINGLNPGAPKALNTDFGFHNGVFMPAHGSTADLVQSMLRPEVVEFINSMNEKEPAVIPPPVPMDEMDREQASLHRQSLQDHVMQNTAKFILGQRSFDEWDAYVSELEGINMQQYVDLANEAQESFEQQ